VDVHQESRLELGREKKGHVHPQKEGRGKRREKKKMVATGIIFHPV